MNESEDIVAEERRIYSAEKLTLFLQKLDNETWMQVFNHDGSASSKYDVFYSIFWDLAEYTRGYYIIGYYIICKTVNRAELWGEYKNLNLRLKKTISEARQRENIIV
ncbi:hypothetical protein QE152_g19946 [Popillia japonica]|uniref:Uncharacterized protein n=1 Tax=Popillia japonica TaxID=7064 RepID=A0AAW1KP39_POPJA